MFKGRKRWRVNFCRRNKLAFVVIRGGLARRSFEYKGKNSSRIEERGFRHALPSGPHAVYSVTRLLMPCGKSPDSMQKVQWCKAISPQRTMRPGWDCNWQDLWPSSWGCWSDQRNAKGLSCNITGLTLSEFLHFFSQQHHVQSDRASAVDAFLNLIQLTTFEKLIMRLFSKMKLIFHLLRSVRNHENHRQYGANN